jgi:polyhydroxyalkanoate synthesis repressor PhaR
MPSPRRRAAAAPADRTEKAEAAGSLRILKKYPNRRLYDTRSSSYITLADVKRMVLAAEDFAVRDAKTGEDLTRSILLQIILEEESGGVPMFSAPVLAQIIRFYGHTMQGMMGPYLENSMQSFIDVQNQLVGGQAPLVQNLMSSYLEQSQAMFEKMQEQMKLSGALFPGVPGFPPTKR